MTLGFGVAALGVDEKAVRLIGVAAEREAGGETVRVFSAIDDCADEGVIRGEHLDGGADGDGPVDLDSEAERRDVHYVDDLLANLDAIHEFVQDAELVRGIARVGSPFVH